MTFYTGEQFVLTILVWSVCEPLVQTSWLIPCRPRASHGDLKPYHAQWLPCMSPACLHPPTPCFVVSCLSSPPLQPCPPCIKSCWHAPTRTTQPLRRRPCAPFARAGTAQAPYSYALLGFVPVRFPRRQRIPCLPMPSTTRKWVCSPLAPHQLGACLLPRNLCCAAPPWLPPRCTSWRRPSRRRCWRWVLLSLLHSSSLLLHKLGAAFKAPVLNVGCCSAAASCVQSAAISLTMKVVALASFRVRWAPNSATLPFLSL